MKIIATFDRKETTAQRFGVHLRMSDDRQEKTTIYYEPAGDTFGSLLGEDWDKVHWYATESERDVAYDEMAKRHGYYRQTDTPTQVLIKIVR